MTNDIIHTNTPRAGEPEGARNRTCAPAQPKQEPVNGIPATHRHDEGAVARCSYCGRYTLNPDALGNSFRQPKCECGEKHGWCGSFKKPGADAKWSGDAPTPPSPAMPPDVAEELSGISEVLDEGAGMWRTCTGCHEMFEGHPVGKYPYSKTMRCDLGSGCRECGGIGAIWDNTDYEDFRLYLSETASPPSDEVEKLRGKLLQIIALAEGYGGPDEGRKSGFRVAATIAYEALGIPQPKEATHVEG